MRLVTARFSRRALLLGLASCAAAGGPFTARLSADESESFLSAELSESLVKSALGSLGGAAVNAALGGLMLLVRPDPQTQIMSRLNLIVSKIDQLQTSINRLSAEMKTLVTEARYETATQNVESIVDYNHALMARYDSIASAQNQADMIDRKKKFLQVANVDLLRAACEKWHNALVGFAGGQGILQLWSMAIHQNAVVFGPKAAAAIQANWQYFDSEQARTVMFLIEALNAQEGDRNLAAVRMSDDAMAAAALWRTRRLQQLAVLRGMPEGRDKPFHYFANGRDQVEQTPIKFLPANTLIDTATGLMWKRSVNYVSARGPTEDRTMGDAEHACMRAQAHAKLYAAAPAPEDMENFPGWMPAGLDEMQGLVRDTGGSESQFTQALKNAGFVFSNRPSDWDDPQEMVIYADSNKPGPGSRVCVASIWHHGTNYGPLRCFIEGRGVDFIYSDSDEYMVMLCRPYSQADADRIFYSAA